MRINHTHLPFSFVSHTHTAAAVFTTNEETLRLLSSRIEAGYLWQNCSQPVPPQLPWGGVKQSGVGRELGGHVFLPYLEPKALCRYRDPGRPLAYYSHFVPKEAE